MKFLQRIKQGIQVMTARGPVGAGRAIFRGATMGSQSTSPSSGPDLLQAFNATPWLRATVSKIAYSVSTLEWAITRTTEGIQVGGNVIEIGVPLAKRTTWRKDIQKGGPDGRRKALSTLEDKGEAEIVHDHPLPDLLKNICPAIPGRTGLWLSQVYYQLTGEAFFVIDRGPRDAWIKSDFTGRQPPKALWPVPPYWVQRTPSADRPTFDIRHNALQLNDVPMTEVLWLKLPNVLNPYGRGIGFTQSISDEIMADENAARLENYAFYNNGRPDLLVSLEGADDKQLEAFQNDWRANLTGVRNAMKTYFTNGKVDAKILGYNFEHLQLIDLREFSRDLIRQVQGIPPEILGILDQSNRSTIDSSEYIFLKHVVIPQAEVWREFFQIHVVPEYDPRAVLDYVNPVQEDKNFALAVIGAGGPARVNEYRKLAGLSPIPPEEGGDLWITSPGTYKESLVEAAPEAPPGSEAMGLLGGGIHVPGASAMTLEVPGAKPTGPAALPAARPGTQTPTPAGGASAAPGGGLSINIPKKGRFARLARAYLRRPSPDAPGQTPTAG